MIESAEFVLVPSKQLPRLLHLLFLLASLTILFLHIHFFWKLAMMSLLVGFWYKTTTQMSPKSPNFVVRICHIKEKQFRLETNKGYCVLGSVKGDSFLCQWFIVLRLRLLPGTLQLGQSLSRSITLFIARDSLSEFEYRLLYMRLLFY